MKHKIELTERQLEIISDLLEERLEDIDEDIAHYEEHPEELRTQLEPGEEPLTIADYEGYRDEVQTLLSVLPDPPA
jgi:hypothetical protein